MDRPPQGHSDVLGIIIGMTQVKCCTAGGKWQGFYPGGESIRHPLLSFTGNLGILGNDVSKDKTLFSSEVLPLPRVFGSFAFSRETVLQRACLSIGCREGTARAGSECLRREFGGVSGGAAGPHPSLLQLVCS